MPRMRSEPRALLAFLAWTTGATLLAIALLDYLAYEFALAELYGYEGRLHPPVVPDLHIRDPWSLGLWIDVWLQSPHAGLLLACCAIGLSTGIAACIAVRRAPALLSVAAACLAVLPGLALVATREFRAGPVRDLFLEIEPGTRLRWLWSPPCSCWLPPSSRRSSASRRR